MSTPTTTLKFPLHEFFPKETYKEVAAKNKKLTPHYLIALNQPKDAVMKWVAKNPSYEDPIYGLTPLAVATLAQNHPLMEELLKREDVDPNVRDKANFAPIHYAQALQDEKGMALLSAAKKSNAAAATVFPDLFKAEMPKPDEIVFEYRNQEGQIVPGTAAKFQEMTGAQFYEGVVITPENWLGAMVSRMKNPPCQAALSIGQLLGYETKSKPPQLFVGDDGQAGLGLFCAETLKPNQFLQVYGGKLNPAHQPGDYTFGDIKAGEIRNLVAFCNDGFPNLAAFDIYLEDGRRNAGYFSADELPHGSALYWDYGPIHSIKKMGFKPLNYEAMKTFFQKKGPLELINFLLNQRATKTSYTTQEIIESRGINVKLVYIFNTPASLFYLLLDNIVTPEELEQCLNHPELREVLLDLNDEAYAKQIIFLSNSIAISRQVMLMTDDCENPALKEEFRTHFFTLLETHGIFFMALFFSCLFEYNTLEEWKERDVNVYDRDINMIATFNERFSLVSETPIPDEYIGRCRTTFINASKKTQLNVIKTFSPLLKEVPAYFEAFKKIFAKKG